MDVNAVLKSILTKDVLSHICKATGLNEEQVVAILVEVLPVLIKAIKDNSSNKEKSKGLAGALLSHAEKNSDDMLGFMKNIDAEDGAKIVKHLLGSEKERKAQKISEKSGVDIKKVALVMALAAPLVMNKLGKSAKKKAKENSKSDVADVVSAIVENIDVADVIKVAKLFL